MVDKQMQPEVYLSATFWGDCFDTAAAFTVAELGEMLPPMVRSRKNVGIDEDGKNFKCLWYKATRVPFTDDNEANTRGKILIYLIEHGLA